MNENRKVYTTDTHDDSFKYKHIKAFNDGM